MKKSFKEMNKFELLGQVAIKCMEIGENTKADVFLNYYSHCKCYDIHYYENGFDDKEEPIYIDMDTDTTKTNLIKTLKELDKLEKRIKEEM